jgi:hypothetical protein
VGYFAELSCAKSMSPNCQFHDTRATVPTLSIPLHIVDCLSVLQTAQNEHLYRLPNAKAGFAHYQLFLAIIIICNSALYKKNEAIVLQSFIHIFGMTGIIFKFCGKFQKVIS